MSGEEEYKLLAKYLSSAGIYIEFTLRLHIKIKNDHRITDKYSKIISSSSTNVIIICGTVTFELFVCLTNVNDYYSKKTVILASNWGANDIVGYNPILLNYSLVLVPGYHYDLDTPQMRDFLQHFHPSNYPEDNLLDDIWIIHLYCLSKDPNKNKIYKNIYDPYTPLHNCTGQERITDFPHFSENCNSPRVHLAVDMMSRALHDLNLQFEMKSVRNGERFLYKSEVLPVKLHLSHPPHQKT
ncbi:hypothetical protein XENTR_v10000037 [Xenopus tropicalis]|nr:hypothetical protein XENTR_v10000037 [Xenopus tropicalis]